MADDAKISTAGEQWDELNKKLDDLKNKQESKRWQVLFAVITALIAFGAWFVEHNIETHIDQAKSELTTRLAITQQFYARKLAIYEEVHRQMASLVSALKDARFNTGAKTAALDSLHELYLAYTQRSLYLSDPLVTHLASLVAMGNQLPPLSPKGNATMIEINHEVASIEDQMKKDLQIEELGRIPM
jgi:hypothetical protein